MFYKLTVPRKVTVMLGGPVMNLLIATVLFGGIFTLYGLPEITPKLSSVSQCVDVKQAGQTSAAACTPDMPVAPANAAGLKPGDTLLSIAGTKVSTWRTCARPSGHLDKPMTIVYERDGQSRTVVAKPLVLDLPVYDDQGQPTTNDAGRSSPSVPGSSAPAAHRRSCRSPSPRSPVSSGSRSPERRVWC